MQHTLKQLRGHNVNSSLIRGPGGIREQTKHQPYATAWRLEYQEVSAISKGYGEIPKSVLSNTDANPLHKGFRNKNISEYNDIMTQQTIFFITGRVNSYETPMSIHPAN